MNEWVSEWMNEWMNESNGLGMTDLQYGKKVKAVKEEKRYLYFHRGAFHLFGDNNHKQHFNMLMLDIFNNWNSFMK